MSRTQAAVAILANACLVAIPVIVFTGAAGDLNLLAGYGLAVAWVIALITALCAGTPTSPPPGQY